MFMVWLVHPRVLTTTRMELGCRYSSKIVYSTLSRTVGEGSNKNNNDDDLRLAVVKFERGGTHLRCLVYFCA